MRNKYLVKTICMILVILLFSGLVVACDSEEGCSGDLGYSILNEKALAMNNRIVRGVCCGSSVITHKQFEVSICNFEDIQVNYSKQLICEEKGVNYYYPDFKIQKDYKDYKVTENTRYILSPLETDPETDIYTGIRIEAFEAEPEDPTELQLKIEEINSKLLSFECFGLTEEEMDEKVADFNSFAAAHNNKVFYVDEQGNEYRYPVMICNNTKLFTIKMENPRYCLTHDTHDSSKENGIYKLFVVRLYEASPSDLDLGLL